MDSAKGRSSALPVDEGQQKVPHQNVRLHEYESEGRSHAKGPARQGRERFHTGLTTNFRPPPFAAREGRACTRSHGEFLAGVGDYFMDTVTISKRPDGTIGFNGFDMGGYGTVLHEKWNERTGLHVVVVKFPSGKHFAGRGEQAYHSPKT